MNEEENQIYLGIEPEHFEREGMQITPEIWEDGQRTPLDRHHFEWWYFDAELDDGAVLVIIFAPKPFFDTHFPITPIISIDYRPVNGDHLREFFVEKKWRKNYSSSKEMCDVRIKDNFFIGDLKEYQIKAKTKTIVVELSLKNHSKPWRPGNGFLYFSNNRKKEKYFAWFPSVPYGKVEGTITIKGVTKTITGRGYHDHNWGRGDPSSMFLHWYWSRSHFGRYILLAGILVSVKDYNYMKLPYILLLDEKGILADDNTKLTFEQKQPILHPKTKKTVYNLLAFDYQDEKLSFSMKLQRKKDIVLQNLILMNSPHLFCHQIGKNPWYHRFLGDSQLVVKKEGKEEHFESRAIYELMYYGKNLK